MNPVSFITKNNGERLFSFTVIFMCITQAEGASPFPTIDVSSEDYTGFRLRNNNKGKRHKKAEPMAPLLLY